MIMLTALLLFSYYVTTTMKNYLYEEERLSVTTVTNVISSFAADFMDKDTFEVDAESVDKFISEMGINSRMRVLILDNNAMVRYDSFESSSTEGTVQMRPAVIDAVGGKDGYTEYTDGSMGVTIDSASPITLSDGKPAGAANIVYVPESINKFMKTIMTEIFFLVIAISLIVGIVIFVVANLVTKRIVSFTSKITSMGDDGILDEKLDISGNDEITRLGEAFNAMSEKVAEAEHRRVRFVSDASHELKTPLSSIKLMADSILQTPDISAEYVREFMGDINNEVDRLNRIVNKLLYITKMDVRSESEDKKLVPVSLNDIFQGIEKSLLPIAKNSDINLVFSSPGEIVIPADRDVLWQGIYNIVDNAIKYSNPGGYILVTMQKQDGSVIIQVRDNGVGIAKEDIDKIFDRFYRVDKARSRETGGTGLGLSIALGAIKYHGGEINVTSELGKGSEFTIILPDTNGGKGEIL